MKRLFILKDRNGFEFVGIPRVNGALAFGDKLAAKERREELNMRGEDCQYLRPDAPFTVAPGPDHRRYSAR